MHIRHRGRLIALLVGASFLSAPVYAQEETIPETIARGVTGRFQTTPSGKVPELSNALKHVELVVRGTVGKPTSELSSDLRRVYTNYPIENVSVLYGVPALPAKTQTQPGRTIPVTVTLRGGTITINGTEFRDVEQALPGLEPGTECVFLLVRYEDHYFPLGFYLGAFQIAEGTLRPVSTRFGHFAPEYREMPTAAAVNDLITRTRAAREAMPPK